jgi:hypothetical protein
MSIAAPQPVVTLRQSCCNPRVRSSEQSIARGGRNEEAIMKATAHRFLGALGFALTATALLAGAAQAAERPDDRGGMIGVGAAQVGSAAPDAFERAVLRNAAAKQVPDAFERAVQRESQTVAVRPDDRAGARGPGIVPTALPTVTASSSEGFSWDDAFMGAAAMLGVVLLGAAATLTLRRRGGVVLR